MAGHKLHWEIHFLKCAWQLANAQAKEQGWITELQICPKKRPETGRTGTARFLQKKSLDRDDDVRRPQTITIDHEANDSWAVQS
jgi:hypothetical protein